LGERAWHLFPRALVIRDGSQCHKLCTSACPSSSPSPSPFRRPPTRKGRVAVGKCPFPSNASCYRGVVDEYAIERTSRGRKREGVKSGVRDSDTQSLPRFKIHIGNWSLLLLFHFKDNMCWVTMVKIVPSGFQPVGWLIYDIGPRVYMWVLTD
jgi:hypothetical protein